MVERVVDRTTGYNVIGDGGVLNRYEFANFEGDATERHEKARAMAHRTAERWRAQPCMFDKNVRVVKATW